MSEKQTRKPSRLTRKEKKRVRDTIETLEQRSLGNLDAREVPSLGVMLRRIQWAFKHEGQFTEKYLSFLWDDINVALSFISDASSAMNVRTDDNHETILRRTMSKKRSK